MEASTFRDDALVEVDNENGCLKFRGALVAEFLSPERVCALGARTELTFKPNMIYKVYTGISVDFLTTSSLFTVRPVDKLFAKGVEVKRVEFGEQDEIIVYLTTMEAFPFVKNEFMFEMYPHLNSTTDQPDIQLRKKNAKKLEKKPLPTVVLKENQPPVSQTANKNPEKVVEDWLNSSDKTEGKAVPTPEVKRPPYNGPAVVKAATAGSTGQAKV